MLPSKQQMKVSYWSDGALNRSKDSRTSLSLSIKQHEVILLHSAPLPLEDTFSGFMFRRLNPASSSECETVPKALKTVMTKVLLEKSASDHFAPSSDCAVCNLYLFTGNFESGLCLSRKKMRISLKNMIFEKNQCNTRVNFSNEVIACSSLRWVKIEQPTLGACVLTDISDTRHNTLIDCLELWVGSCMVLHWCGRGGGEIILMVKLLGAFSQSNKAEDLSIYPFDSFIALLLDYIKLNTENNSISLTCLTMC